MNKRAKPHIWILEDDEGCRFVYQQILKSEFKTTYFDSIQKFKRAFEGDDSKRPTMVIADLVLNDGNFLNFLTYEFSGRLGDHVPFIVVSSDDDIESLRLCFKEGANDYMTKPFKKNELLVKVETTLKNHNMFNRSIRPQLEVDGQKIDGLTLKQYKLLSLFVDSDDRVVERGDILDKVWGDTSVHYKTIDVHLYNLRRKIHPYGLIIKSLGSGKWLLRSDKL